MQTLGAHEYCVMPFEGKLNTNIDVYQAQFGNGPKVTVAAADLEDVALEGDARRAGLSSRQDKSVGIGDVLVLSQAPGRSRRRRRVIDSAIFAWSVRRPADKLAPA